MDNQTNHSLHSVSEFDMLAIAEYEGARYRVLVSFEYRVYGWIARYHFDDDTAPTDGEIMAVVLNTPQIMNRLRVLQLRNKQVQALNYLDDVLVNLGNHKSPTAHVEWVKATFITFIDDNLAIKRDGHDSLVYLSRYCVKVLGGD